MLTEDTIRKMNDQIQEELEIVDRITYSHQEKMDALERIAKLKEILAPQNHPSPDETLSQLATALIEKQKTDHHKESSLGLVVDILSGFRRR